MAARKKKGAKAGKKGGWTAKAKDIFFAELGEVCNVAAAARKAGFDGGESAYRMMARNAEFRARYDAAVREGYSRLELEMLERARFGENRPAEAGESSAKLREVPTALAMSLLKLHEARVRGGGGGQPAAAAPARRPLRGNALRRKLETRLAEINRRLGGNG